jgi:ABC-type antimicrobial peptide transport system permease subunit
MELPFAYKEALSFLPGHSYGIQARNLPGQSARPAILDFHRSRQNIRGGVRFAMNSIPAVLFVTDVVGTLGGMCVMQMTKLSRKATALSGGVMLGAAIFWIWPDLTKAAGLEHSFLTVAAAVAALYAIDRFVCLTSGSAFASRLGNL